MQQLVNDVVQCHVKRQGVQSYLYTYNEGWDYVEGYAPRLLESVVLEPGEKEHLTRQAFLRDGIPLTRDTLADLRRVAGELGVSIASLETR